MSKLINVIIIFKFLSRNLLIISFALLACGCVAYYYSESLTPFIISSLISFVIGGGFLLFSKKHDENVYINQRTAYLTVSISWFFMVITGSLPYLFSGCIPSYIDAVFESVSGFTTTGASILVNVEELPKSILFWRSMTHWIGGIGIILLVIIVMPSLKINRYHLFTLESSIQTKIQPRLKSIGLRLLFIYLLLTISEIILLRLGNMNFFESICHAFGTVATGGFSPKNSSIGGYSGYIQYVIMIFMFLSGTNFIIHYYLLKRDFKKIRINEEFRFYFLIVAIIGFIITGALYFEMQKPFEVSFREAFFQVISIITCTGFATTDYLLWPAYAWMLIFFSMFLGGCAGSTAGGIKIVRHLVVLKNIKAIIKKMYLPHCIINIYINKKKLESTTNNSILTFVSVYLLVFLIGFILLVLFNVDMETASSSVATCMAGIGPGIGTVGPASNFAHLPDMAKITLSLLMIIGRLEIYTIIVLFTRSFWKQ